MTFSITTPKGKRAIGPGEPCFIIAEMSGNHHQDFDKAVEIIKAAAKAGADAIKIQTYTPDTMTLNSDKEWFIVKGKDNPETWKGQKLYDLYIEAQTPWDWDAKLQEEAAKVGLAFFSTPFDLTAVDFLEKLDVPLYKISSYEATDIPLLRRVAQTHKPVILSVGFASESEIDLAVATLRDNGAKDIALLHCVTAYAGEPNLGEINLRTMLDLQKKYGVVAGFSDNNAGTVVPILAAAMGASIIEKHFMIEREEGGPDARFSIEPGEFEKMVTEIRRAEKIMGTVHYGCQGEQEAQNRVFRRSLFVSEPIKKGQQFTAKNVRCVRPANGLETKYYDKVMGKTAAQDIEFGTPLSRDLIENM